MNVVNVMNTIVKIKEEFDISDDAAELVFNYAYDHGDTEEEIWNWCIEFGGFAREIEEMTYNRCY